MRLIKIIYRKAFGVFYEKIIEKKDNVFSKAWQSFVIVIYCVCFILTQESVTLANVVGSYFLGNSKQFSLPDANTAWYILHEIFIWEGDKSSGVELCRMKGKKEKSGIRVLQMPDQSVCFFRCFFMDKIRYLFLTGYVHFWMTFWRSGDNN